MEMLALNRNRGKWREDIILIGFQVGTQRNTVLPKIPKHEIFTSTDTKMTHEDLLVLILSQTREVQERTVNLRKSYKSWFLGMKYFKIREGKRTSSQNKWGFFGLCFVLFLEPHP